MSEPSLEDQAIEAELHHLGLRDRAEQLSLQRRTTPEMLSRLRQRIPSAEAAARTLRSLADDAKRTGDQP